MIQKRQRIFIICLLIVASCGALFAVFMDYHEPKVDAMKWYFDDPAFDILPAYDCSAIIFSITYGSLILFALTHFKKHFVLSKLAIAYAIMLIFRVITMTALPLKEPESIIFLDDVFLNTFIYQGELNADLFFSGHTGLLFILYFLSEKKWYFLVLGVTLGILLMIQRVHYSIDVLAAIPFAWLTVYLTNQIFKRIVRPQNA